MTDYILPSPRKVSALYDYPAENPHELNFHEGDTIEVVNTFNNTGWWYGSREGKYGIFPSNYCVPASEQRKLKKRGEDKSIFIKKMQLELGFVRKGIKSDDEDTVPPDSAEENVIYQKMIMEMKDHIAQLEKDISSLKADNTEQTAVVGELKAQLDAARKKEIEAYTEMALQTKLIASVEHASPIDEAFAVIADLRSQNAMMRDEIDSLSVKLEEALHREEGALFIMEEQQKQLGEHQHSALEEKLHTQLDEALRKEEEAYNSLAVLQAQIIDLEEYSRKQTLLVEKMSSQLDDALKKEEEADNFIIEQQKLLVEAEEAKQKYAEKVEKMVAQVEEGQERELGSHNLVKELLIKVTANEELNRQLRRELEEAKINRERQLNSRKEDSTVIVAELQKRHISSSDIDNAADDQAESVKKIKPIVSRPSRNTYVTPMIYFLIGISFGALAAFSYHC